MPSRSRPLCARRCNRISFLAAALCIGVVVVVFSFEVHKKLPNTLRRTSDSISTTTRKTDTERLPISRRDTPAEPLAFVRSWPAPVRVPPGPAAATASSPPPPVPGGPPAPLSPRVPRQKFPVSREDLVVAIPTSDQHLPLVQASRVWRKGVRSLVAVNSTAVAEQQQARFETDKEAWRFYSDDELGISGAYRGLHASDTRAAVAPYLAHHVFGDNYKWILYGDDDTMWFMEGVLKFLEDFDPEMPYFLTDNMWWSSTRDVIGYQPNLEAPRCLPCHHDSTGEAWRPFDAPVGCPCTPRLLCDTYKPGVFNAACDIPIHPERTYSMHGGAGGLLSIGLMRIVDLDFIEDCIDKQAHASGGDAFITICLWRAGFAHTDPGWSFSRPEVRMFDPVGDGPNLLALLTNASQGQVDATRKVMLDHMVSAHIRSRTSSILEASDLQVAVAGAYQAYLAAAGA